MLHNPDSLCLSVINIATDAADLMLREMDSAGDYLVTIKPDHTPVTDLDKRLNDFIVAKLTQLTPGVAILAEEDLHHEPSTLNEFWCVDPIDGTKGWLAGSQDYCINIALVQDGLPVLAVIYAPALSLAYYADSSGAYRLVNGRRHLMRASAGRALHDLRLLTGVFHRIDDMVQRFMPEWLAGVSCMNSALKFCSIASGLADIYVRLGATGLWDAAAGQFIVEQAGGCVVDFSGKKLQYRPEFGLINSPFIVLGNPEHLPAVIKLCQTIRGYYDK